MAIVLFRVDERLIHGQVVIGWGSQLHFDRYLVVDDRLARAPWEQDLFRLSLADEDSAVFTSVDEARQKFSAWSEDPLRSALLTRDVETMLRLAEGSRLSGVAVNLGCLHHAEGRVKVKPYLHLDVQDAHRLRELADGGAIVTAQDLPGAVKVGLEAILRGVLGE